jgi:hypothetical protein
LRDDVRMRYNLDIGGLSGNIIDDLIEAPPIRGVKRIRKKR